MDFRTEITIPQSPFQIEHWNKIVTIGSCFAENIANYLKSYRFNVLENPFGVLYNPLSIYKALQLVSEKTVFRQDDLIYHDSEWHSFYHHSDFSDHDPEVCLKNINDKLQETHRYLKKADYLIITYGTAYVYFYRKNNRAVANCHKIPAYEFERQLISLKELERTINDSVNLISKLNPELKLILSISPIRHRKDGAVKNQVSKSSLILATHNVIDSQNNCVYFPAYEIMMDDLRDYRFYEKNLTHPNQLATDYIWEKFCHCCFTETCRRTLEDIEKLKQARRHRPRNLNSENHQQFIRNQLQLIEQLTKKYPYLNVEDDYNYFMSQKR